MKDDLEKAGTQLVYIAAEKREGWFKPARFLGKHPIGFPFLLDQDRAVTKAYGLHHWLGIDAIDIAHPASLVVDREGVIRYIYQGAGQTDRAPIEELMAAARKLSGE